MNDGTPTSRVLAIRLDNESADGRQPKPVRHWRMADEFLTAEEPRRWEHGFPLSARFPPSS